MSSMAPRSADETITTWTRRFLIALTILAWFGIAVMVIWGLRLIGSVILLYSIAGLLAFVLYPVVKALGRVIGQRIAALLVMLATVLALAVVLYFLGATVIEEAGVLSATGWRFWVSPTPFNSSPGSPICWRASASTQRPCNCPGRVAWASGGRLRRRRCAGGRSRLCADQCRRGLYHHDLLCSWMVGG